MISDLVGSEIENARHNSAVWIRKLAIASRHHRLRMECIEVQVKIYLPQCIWRIVLIVNELMSVHLMPIRMQRDIDLVGDSLLPVIDRLCMNRLMSEEKGEDTEKSVAEDHSKSSLLPKIGCDLRTPT